MDELTIKNIRMLSGLSQVEFASQYEIPLQTLKNWESNPESKNFRQCPIYTLKLLNFKVRMDTYIRRIDFTVTEKWLELEYQTQELSALYNNQIISEEELTKILESGKFGKDDRYLIVSRKGAEKFLQIR